MSQHPSPPQARMHGNHGNHSVHDNPFVPIPPPPRRSPNSRTAFPDSSAADDRHRLNGHGDSHRALLGSNSGTDHNARGALAAGAGGAVLGAAAMHHHNNDHDHQSQQSTDRPFNSNRFSVNRKPVGAGYAPVSGTVPSMPAHRSSDESGTSSGSQGYSDARQSQDVAGYDRFSWQSGQSGRHHGMSRTPLLGAAAAGVGAMGGAAMMRHHDHDRKSQQVDHVHELPGHEANEHEALVSPISSPVSPIGTWSSADAWNLSAGSGNRASPSNPVPQQPAHRMQEASRMQPAFEHGRGPYHNEHHHLLGAEPTLPTVPPVPSRSPKRTSIDNTSLARKSLDESKTQHGEASPNLGGSGGGGGGGGHQRYPSFTPSPYESAGSNESIPQQHKQPQQQQQQQPRIPGDMNWQVPDSWRSSPRGSFDGSTLASSSSPTQQRGSSFSMPGVKSFAGSNARPSTSTSPPADRRGVLPAALALASHPTSSASTNPGQQPHQQQQQRHYTLATVAAAGSSALSTSPSPPSAKHPRISNPQPELQPINEGRTDDGHGVPMYFDREADRAHPRSQAQSHGMAQSQGPSQAPAIESFREFSARSSNNNNNNNTPHTFSTTRQERSYDQHGNAMVSLSDLVAEERAKEEERRRRAEEEEEGRGTGRWSRRGGRTGGSGGDGRMEGQGIGQAL
ncbi:hypothetical protein LTS18_002356 [Coniosporium uncinatum]|uniref:Uncharacterized protein n=1 Tax=Coniosporium uncinatum TaxID=93489 RepID=A0ACC3DUN8_9PEZI|nr:hypothetical protein LTS18_002356 [Coniosporium uncinatum]